MHLLFEWAIGDWKIAKEDIDCLPDNFSIYTKPVKGIITKKVLSKAIENREVIECDVLTSHLLWYQSSGDTHKQSQNNK